jgi:hypothetical protein
MDIKKNCNKNNHKILNNQIEISIQISTRKITIDKTNIKITTKITKEKRTAISLIKHINKNNKTLKTITIL